MSESFDEKRPAELMDRRMYKGRNRGKVSGKYREAGKRWRGHKKQKNREEENNGEGRRQIKQGKWTKKRENPTHKGGGKQNRANSSRSGEIFHSGIKVTMLFLAV